MSQPQQSKPLSPQQLFHRLTMQSYREVQCQDQEEKLKKQKLLLLELIGQYEVKIEQQLVKVNQYDELSVMKLERIEELERLKREREVVEMSVKDEIQRIQLTQVELEEKTRLIGELTEIRLVNDRIRLKLDDLRAYAAKLQLHNQQIQEQKLISQHNMVNRLRVNSQDWQQDIEAVRKRQQLQQNHYRAKILQKQSQNLKHIRQQQQEIHRRNQQKWQQFRQTALRPSPIAPISTINGYPQKILPTRTFQRFRVI